VESKIQDFKVVSDSQPSNEFHFRMGSTFVGNSEYQRQHDAVTLMLPLKKYQSQKWSHPVKELLKSIS
jgi:hypothetical protein